MSRGNSKPFRAATASRHCAAGARAAHGRSGMAHRGTRDGGYVLVAVLGLMVLLMGMGRALHTSGLSETHMRGAHLRATTAFYAAEAGVNRSVGALRNIFESYNVPSGRDLAVKTMTIGSRQVDYSTSLVPGGPTQVTIPVGKPFAGLNSIRYQYAVNAISSLNGDQEVTLGAEFDVNYIPLFQFLAFYENDLEILPGPNMVVHGPIHSNGDLYLNGPLTIADLPPQITSVHVSAAGDIKRGRKDSSVCDGTVRVAKLEDADRNGTLDLQTVSCGGTMSTTSLNGWFGAMRSHQPVLSVPPPDVLARGTGSFWAGADLRIVLDATSPDANGLFPIVVQDEDGSVDRTKTARLHAFMAAAPGHVFYNDVPRAGQDAASACTARDSYCNPTSYAAPFPGAVYPCGASDLNLYPGCPIVANELYNGVDPTARRGGFYNNREHAWVYMLNVNVHDLVARNRAMAPGDRLFDPDDTSNGGVVLFLSVVGGSGVTTPRLGVRVFGSPNLGFPAGVADPTGLTVVSDQAIYVEGDYNVGSGLAPKQPAAILGDTLNILSSNWSGVGACRNDCQSRQPLAARPGASTTINAGFLAGVDTTRVGTYNGGLENYPRFHEDWSRTTLTYRGSFVSLGEPLHADGAWCGTGAGCNIYNPPVRNWDYDTDFQDAANLPPLTPRALAVDQILYTENFR